MEMDGNGNGKEWKDLMDSLNAGLGYHLPNS